MKIIKKIGSYSITKISDLYFVENGSEGLGYTNNLKKAERIFEKALKYEGL